jgi:hypothetical protein
MALRVKQRVLPYRAKGLAARIVEAVAIARMHASEIVDWDQTAEREKRRKMRRNRIDKPR